MTRKLKRTYGMPSKSNNIKQTIVFSDSDSSPLFRACRKVLTTLRPEWNVAAIDEYDKKEKTKPVGLMVASSMDSFFEKFNELDKQGCDFIVVVSIYGYIIEPWKSLATYYANAFERRCLVASFELADIRRKVGDQITASRKTSQGFRTSICSQVCAAKWIYGYIDQFGHSGKYDITNAFLAPARMLCGKSPVKPDWGIVERFEEEAIIRLESQASDELSLMLLKAWRKILPKQPRMTERKEVLDTTNVTAEDFAAVMHLLTEIRVLAGVKLMTEKEENEQTKQTKAAQGLINPAGMPDTPDRHRILIIDDHAESWVPCFRQIQTKMAVEIYIAERPVSNVGDSPVYSLDDYEMCRRKKRKGEKTELQARSLSRSIAEYDLVLLDIFYSTDKTTGLEFLREMRSRRIYVPVILWTTSMDKDLPAEAVLANGYLFKKETDIDAIVHSLLGYLELGRGKHEMPLMHPFFAHVVVSSNILSMIRELTLWCLRFADSFHAADTTHLRFFNDHGGRHLWGVMVWLEKLLSPFLLDQNQTLLPYTDRKEFEREILSFYIAAICHELGMWPYKFERDELDDDSLRVNPLKTMRQFRKLHALRSFALIQPNEIPGPDNADLKVDQEFNELRAILDTIKKNVEYGDRVLRHAALLIAYHSSRLEFGGTTGFGRLTPKAEKAMVDNITLAGAGIMPSTVVLRPDSVDEMLSDCIEPFANDIERMKKQCAMFMLADELDVDWTRLPADFILRAEDRNPKDDRENFKRQVVECINMEEGQVAVVVRCIPPSQIRMREFIEDYGAPTVDKSVCSSFQGWLCNHSKSDLFIDCTNLQGPFDNLRIADDEDFRYGLNAFDLTMQRFFGTPAKERTTEHKFAASWFTALWVACELRGKFDTVRNVGMDYFDLVRLECIPGYDAEKLRTQLTILASDPPKEVTC